MSLITREPIYAALFARVAAATWAALGPDAITAFKLTSRKLLHWTDPSIIDSMPCLFQTQRTETVIRERGKPPIWKLNVELFIYVKTLANQDAAVIPSQQENPILDAVVAILEPSAYPSQKDSPDACTLGGLVNYCKVQGTVENFEGDLGDLGVLIVPVEIVVHT